MIGLDVGTTGCKAVAVDARLHLIAVTGATYPMYAPQSDHAEQDVNDVWRGCLRCLRALTQKLARRKVAGLALSGAMHSLLAVDAHDQVLMRAWTWADARCAASAQQLREGKQGHALYQQTGCPVQTMYHPARLHWLRRHDQALWRKQPKWVSIKDVMLHRLTGRWVTDVSIASATGLLDLQTRRWHQAALQQLSIDETQLPELVGPTTVVGGLSAKVARLVGLPTGLPVLAGGSDGAMANVGAGAVQGGEIVATVGTTGAVRRITSKPMLDKLARSWCYVLDEKHYLSGGAINNGGLTLQWLHDRLFAHQGGYKALFHEAGKIAPGADGLTLLPYFTGERCPHWNPHLRASWIGLSLAHQRGHMARAGLEAVAYCLRDVWDLITTAKQRPKLLRLTGGITRSPLWCQIVADVLGVTLAPLEAADASAVGAAMMGWVAVQPTDSLTTLAQHVRLPGKRYHPDPRRQQVYAALHHRFVELGSSQ